MRATALVSGLLALSLGGVSATRGPFIPRIFGPSMLLEKANARVWGWSAVGEVVNGTATCGSNKFSAMQAVADADGLFVLTFPPQPATTGCSITVSSASLQVTWDDVSFGSLFLCGGQSNMHLDLLYAFNGTEEAAIAPKYSWLRLLQMETVASATVNMSDIQAAVTMWGAPTTASASAFSAACWFFGRHLADILGPKEPIGLVQMAWPSTYILQHSPPDVQEHCGNPPDAVVAADASPASVTPCTGDNCKIWYSFYSPLSRGPLAITGFVWLQGETDRDHPPFYNCALPAFITALRAHFQSPSAWFNVMQLAPWVAENNTDVAFLRDAQTNASTTVGNVSLTVQVDLGDPQAPAGSIHSRNKGPLGQRAAWLAAANLYRNASYAQYVSPRYLSATGSVSGSTLTATVQLDPATVGSGLQIVPAACPTDLGVPITQCSWLLIGASDGNLYNATITVGSDGKSLVLTAQATAPVDAAGAPLQVVSTANGFSDYPVAVVFNSLGLPLAPWPPAPVTA